MCVFSPPRPRPGPRDEGCCAVEGSVASPLSPLQTGANIMCDGMMVENMLTRFQWNEAKHPARRSLRETIEKIQESVAKIEDDLKIKVGEYNNVKSTLSAAARKMGGSLAVRDLSSVVTAEHIVESEHLHTCIVVVSKHSAGEWLKVYETLTDYVVPRSSKLVSEDNDYALYTVVLFRRVESDFTAAARERGFQVRDHKHNPEAAATRSVESTRLEGEFAEMKVQLEDWCRTAYGEAFGFWMHLSAVRLFVESILRYGLPPCFQAAVCKPQPKHEQKLRAALAANFGKAGSVHWKDVGTEDSKAGPGGDVEAYPYVSFTVNI
mmetsp:Transcript_44714/g.142395  ORF Transcript_44714/g.142395 Transcript_44714/m.142395 type:complete len:322 (+) Transcript_44714:399-1364(+)